MAAKEKQGLDGDIEKSCENCRFYAAQGDESTQGDCRRYAPHPSNVRVRDIGERGTPRFDAWWPVMSHDDWCGEFEAIDGENW